MGDSRFTSIAYGKYNNFAANTAGLFAESDTTPDVTNGVLFYTNNTSNTTITHFDLSVPGGGAGSNAGEFEGKVIKVIFLDDSTRLVNGGRLVLNGSNGLQGPNNSIELLYHNSSWVEFNRSYNQSNVITVDSATWRTVSSVVPNASTGNIIITGRGPHVVLKLVHEATSMLAIRRAIGGEEGQLLTLIAAGGSHSLVIVNSDTTDTFICKTSASSTQFRMASSSAITFIYNNRRWHELTPIIAGTGGLSVGV